jgi:TonB family protein
VGLELVVDEGGTVTDARVTDSAGHGFDEAALAAIRKFTFEPARRGDTAVRSRVQLAYEFHLPPTPTSTSTSTPTSTSTSTSTPTSTSTSTPTPTPTSTPTPPPPPPLTGGSLLIGDIVSPKSFDPKSTLVSLEPQFIACYNQARATTLGLRGKVKLLIHVNEGGTCVGVDAEPGGSANDPGLVACLGDAMKAAHFPKPGGSATVIAPLVFRP